MLRNMAGTYIRNGNSMLLLYRIGSRVVEPSWCNIGGHLESYELNDPRACALRELYEETGIREEDLCNIKLRYITLRSTKGEIRQNYYFFADLAGQGWQIKDCPEGILEWVGLDHILERPMPFTAKKVLEHYLSGVYMENCTYGGIVDSDTDDILFVNMQEC